MSSSSVVLTQLPISSHHRQIQTEMLLTISQTAFLPALPLTRRRISSLTRITSFPSIANASPPSTAHGRRPFQACADTSDIHDSWRVYSKPGNKCVICCGNGETKCLYCFGEGVVRVGPEAERDTISCPHCEGRGMETCIRCDGSGVRPNTRCNEDGAIVANLTNEEVGLLPLEDYGDADIEENSQRETERETASNGVATT